MPDEVTLTVDDRVAVVTLNRPDRGNAWTVGMEYAFFDALDQCADRTDVGAVVITGAGRSFCVGADTEELSEIGDLGADRLRPRDPRSPMHALRVGKPVVAAINGGCAGMGVVQAAMSDVRFAARGAKITTAFAHRGLVAEHGLSWILPRIVGVGRAADLLFSGRVITGEEAHRLGFVDHLSENGGVLPDAVAYAHELVSRSSPASLAAMKAQLYADLARTARVALEQANALMAKSLLSEDFIEGVDSFLEGRPPRFNGHRGLLDPLD